MNNAKGTRKKGKELTGRNGTYIGTYISTYVFTTYVRMRTDWKRIGLYNRRSAHTREKGMYYGQQGKGLQELCTNWLLQ